MPRSETGEWKFDRATPFAPAAMTLAQMAFLFSAVSNLQSAQNHLRRSQKDVARDVAVTSNWSDRQAARLFCDRADWVTDYRWHRLAGGRGAGLCTRARVRRFHALVQFRRRVPADLSHSVFAAGLHRGDGRAAKRF